MHLSRVKSAARKALSLLATSAVAGTGLVALSVAVTIPNTTPTHAAGLGGPVQLDGMDPVCHSTGESTGQYIAAVLKSLHDQATISGSNNSIAILGTDVYNACGANFDSSNASNDVATQYLDDFAPGSKPTWTLHSDATAINTFFTNLNAGTINPKVIWIADDWGRSGAAETALTNNAELIANFVNAGGGLFSNYGSYGWLGSLLPDADFVDGGCNGGPALSTDGQNAFPTLTDQMVEACWHGSFWGSYPGLVSLVEWPYDALNTGASPTPMAPVAIGGSNVVMPSSFTLVTDPPQAIPSDTVDVIATAIGLDGTIYSGVSVSFSITSGPHAGWTATATTGSDGKAHASLTYLSDGTDAISASATVNGIAKTQTYDLDWATAFTPTRYVDAVLGSMTVGTAYSNGIEADGRPAPTYAVTSGSLPAGLSLDSSTGAISGTPTSAGSFSFEITATNPAGAASKTFNGSVAAPTNSVPSWSDNTLGSMTNSESYSDGVSASGWPTPTYAVSSGSLPAGLSLDSTTGAVTGTPTVTGAYSFTITASNTQGSVSQAFSGSVAPPPTVAPSWSDTTLSDFVAGVSYSDSVSASGVPSPTYAVTSGSLPAGVSLDASTGDITGTPTTAGSYSFELTASNSAGSVTHTVSGTVNAAPSWSDTSLSEVVKDNAYSDGVSADGTPAPTYSVTSGSLPAGLSLDAATGAITGVPTGTGSYSFEVTATNAEGSSSQSFSGTISETPDWTDSTLGVFYMNVGYSDGLTASGVPSPSYAVTSGSLPAGVSLDLATGAITGTPTTAGPYSFDITASSSAGSVTLSFSGAVLDPTPVWSDENLSPFALATPYTNGVSASSDQGVTYSVSAGSLPAGLSLDPATGAITGTPTTAGFYAFNITATADGTSPALSVTLIFTGEVEDTTPTWSDSTIGDIQAGVPFQDGVSGVSSLNVTYTVSAGSLPSGLSLDPATGAITGTVSTPGSYSFDITATSDGGSVTLSFSGTVLDNPPTWSDTTLGQMRHGVPFQDGIQAGSFAPVTYSVTSGSLPAGLSLDATTGEITGTPSTPGAYLFVVTASSDGGDESFVFSVTVEENPPVWSDETVSGGIQGTLFQDGISAGSFAPVTYTITSGALPAGLSLDATTGAITGTPTESGSFSFEITASSEGGSVSVTVSITITADPPVWSDRTLANGVVGVAYSDAVLATNQHNVTYAVTSGSLPSGLSLVQTTGAVTGTPTAAGTFSFSITASSAGGSVVSIHTVTIVSMSFEPIQDTNNTGTDNGSLDFSTAPSGSTINVSPPRATESIPAGVAEIKDSKVVYTPAPGFSGLAKVVVTVTVNGHSEEREYTFTVNPAPASSGQYTTTDARGASAWLNSPRALGNTVISWDASPNAVGYEVRLSGSVSAASVGASSSGALLCSTTTETSCSLPMLAGPSTSYEVVAIGRDSLRSSVVKATYQPVSSERGSKALFAQFGSGSFTLAKEYKAELRALAGQIRTSGFTKVVLVGNTDNRGSITYNKWLSKMRAEAVASYLRPMLPGVKVTVLSRWYSEPMAKNTTSKGRALNRRVDVYLG
jgi:outer membrane protein OmpA-like peptidoglycan-associated protein